MDRRSTLDGMSLEAHDPWADRQDLVWLLIPAILLGLLWMHGLATHGAGTHDASSTPALSVDAHDLSASGHETDAHAMPGEVASTAAVGPSDGQGSAGSALGLCLAVLAGALLTFLVKRRRRLGRFQGLVLARPTRSPKLPARARDPDPPSLSALCIVRC